ncbi:uncharacterized protein YdaU (DUF1376 family) [Janthinobacterium sp. CG_23.3]|uniref:YdaU family protein n=1 Tax=Janthinobacterium sp. CG_23.3 TaxID=3349634 RepID=UPI0038D48F59
MNFYDKHIGDFIRDTVSLTMLEDGAYNRMLDQVYQTERALPLDKKEVYRVARATSAAERKAVDYVLAKFFHATDSGYMQKRAQVVIEEFWDREPAEEAKRESAKVRQQRARARRQNLFDQLREHGVVPEFNTPSKQLAAELSRVTERDRHHSVTRDDTLTHKPLPITHKPNAEKQDSGGIAVPDREDPPEADRPTSAPLPTRVEPPPSNNPAIAMSVALRKLGVTATFTHPAVLDWAEREVSMEILTAAVAKARESKGPTAAIPPNYLVGIVAELLDPPPMAEAKAPRAAGDDWAWKKSDAGIDKKGRELGLFARSGESYRDYAHRIEDAIAKRKGPTP